MKILTLLALTALSGTSALAGTPLVTNAEDSKKMIVAPENEDARLLFRTTSSYVFESDFKRGDDASGDAFSNEVEVGYRFGIGHTADARSHWYLRVGARYGRYDFDNEGGLPLPSTLQSFAGVIALEYLRAGQVGFLLETRPGFYFENDVRLSAFDAPTNLGLAIPLGDNFYGVVGASVGILRSYPVLPVIGFVWRPTPEWNIFACAPQPRVTYSPTKHLSLWAGGELTGGGFQVDSGGKVSNAVVTYTEFRVNAGITWSSKNCSLELGGGYALQRKFDYSRAEKGYETDGGAPFVSLEMRSAF